MKTKRFGLLVVGALFLLLTGFSAQSYAGVRLGVGINLPAYTFAAPPSLAVIPGTYAYYAPDADVDVVFYRGTWYRPYEGRWFSAGSYNGPWRNIAPVRVPYALTGLPHGYRHEYRDHARIDYRDFRKNWRGWERQRRWDNDERWRAGRGGRWHEEGRGHDERGHGGYDRHEDRGR